MKLKNAGLLALHVEKLVILAAVVVTGVILFLFVLGQPYAAKVGPREVSPGEAPRVVLDQAQVLKRRLGDETSPFDEINVTQYAEVFRQRAESPSLAGGDDQPPRLAIGLNRPGLGPDVGGPQGPKPTYHVPGVPVPTDLMASDHGGYAVLDTLGDRTLDRQFIQLVGDHQPRDFRYVSVMATFDMDQWVSRLEGQGQADARLPRRWWQPMLSVAGVFLQRQEMDPATGQWGVHGEEGFQPGQTQLIAPLPNQLACRDTNDQQWTQQRVESVLRQIKTEQQLVARPDFPPVARGTWLPPDSNVVQFGADDQRELSKLFSDINNLQSRILKLQQTLDRYNDQQARREASEQGRRQPAAAPTPAPTPRGGAYGDGGAVGRAIPAPTTGGGGSSQQQQLVDQLQRLNEELAQKKIEQAALMGIERDITTQNTYPQGMEGYGDNYGGSPAPWELDAGVAPTTPYNPRGTPEYGRPQQPPQQMEQVSRQVKVWAHDLTVEPGHTYRYRVVVYVLNPLFRQSRVDPTQRAEHENRIALGPSAEELSAAPWTEPVTVDPEYHFFLIGGNAVAQEGSVEVWRVYNGQWRKVEFAGLEPGDVIGGESTVADADGSEIELDMSVGAMVVDVTPVPGGRGGAAIQMYYIEPETGVLASRSAQADRDSPTRQRLMNEAAIIEALSRSLEPSARAE